ncbi:CRISPR-associated protein Cas4 [Leptolyngbya sp. FACHB-541]|uniref:CRISPR-associated protein Cas4 n=1 Tax=Leptolyngbya sp. FACHB-541 TaxID=2692810 RepID=UPI0016863BC3|nr:CRISPR-associated protein Cas4 [Leptolyngbya sp. FACHB-541]MBD1998456.1 CRISPR-associated protein Cas4 [Leptolyngbya sp. FACHB-541]
MELDDYVLISALQHYAYCPRQCALIHVEQTFDENLYTLRGHRVHETVNIPEYELIEGVRVERALPLWSHQLGLTGIADVVEFYTDGTPYPVEYKSGPRKPREADELQLCAQAICLEEMTGRPVPIGAIFHHASRRRREVQFNDDLRSLVIETTQKVRSLVTTTQLPLPVADERCPDCSLIETCMPYAVTAFTRVSQSNGLFLVEGDA